MASVSTMQPIVVYRIERHPLEVPETRPAFQWLRTDDGFRRELEGLIGAYDPDEVSVIVDKHPAGPAWRELLRSLLEERIRMVITHLAPLTSAQRQQLIAFCAQSGTRLITPGDAGRRRLSERLSQSI